MTTTEAEVDSARGWLVTAAAVTSTFATFGVAYSFGAFFDAMSEEFDVGSGQTAFFFSLTISLSFILGLFTGRWADRVGPRPVLLAAAASLVGGLLATAAVQNIWLGYLTYGLGVGFAVACGYVPMVSVVGSWFVRRRAAALGVAVAGIGLGTLIGSPVAAALIDATSWRTTYVIFGIVGGVLLLGAASVAERGPAAQPTDKPRSLRELLRLRDFAILYVASLFGTFGLFVPFVFLADYAEGEGIGSVPAATLVGVIGGSSVIGRLALGSLADRLDLNRLYIGSFSVMAASHFVWLGAGGRYWQLVLYAAVLGLGYGGFIALSPAVAAQRFGLTGLGGVLGTLYTSAAVGSLGGPPLAGVLIDGPGYSTAITFAGLMTVAATVVMLPLTRLEPQT